MLIIIVWVMIFMLLIPELSSSISFLLNFDLGKRYFWDLPKVWNRKVSCFGMLIVSSTSFFSLDVQIWDILYMSIQKHLCLISQAKYILKRIKKKLLFRALDMYFDQFDIDSFLKFYLIIDYIFNNYLIIVYFIDNFFCI